MAKYLALVVLIWPFLRFRDACEWLWVCIPLGVSLTAALFMLLWLAEELRLLASLRLRHF